MTDEPAHQELADLLLEWARVPHNLRSFPWRAEKDPYRLLMAELMLRRTRASNVVEVYRRFVETWPDLTGFLHAQDEDLLRVLYPLGLRWRAANFIRLRDYMRKTGGAELGEGYSGLLRLPGVGDYVASAVVCLSRGERRPLIDTNSVRVVCRVYGIEPGPETRRRSHFRNRAIRLVPEGEPQLYNYALLDLAATVCTVKRPHCGVCPLEGICLFARERIGSETM